RGWTKQIHSAVAATASGVDATWQHIESTLKPLPDIDSIWVLGRLECGKEPVTGRLEIRNLQLQVVSSEIFPAYAALTASASRSDDGKTAYLIVFNKHPENDIEATIDIKGMKYKSARFWQVSNPPLNAFNTPEQQLVKLIVDGEVMPMTKHEPLTHLFPTRSMTAIELVR
ncbi:MAG: hypothetical protein JKX85_04850, partial [Phycisphaeraceae bacterium]|nr:hypothetical protein [Phycisphaeraceae bacterium]